MGKTITCQQFTTELNEARKTDRTVPSRETLDFLAQMIAEAEPSALQTLQTWRRSYRPQASELLLAYALRARDRDGPVPILHGIDLRGARLRGWTIGTPTRLDLGPARLAGADLREAQLTGLGLEGADVREARLDHAVLIDCRLTSAHFDSASLTATIFRRCHLDASTWTHASGHRTRYLLCHPDPATAGVPGLPSPAQTTPLFAPTPRPPATKAASRLAWLTGQAGWVNACAWSPDGRRLASAGSDGTLRLWDAVGGGALATLTGHKYGVRACAWSPDGRRLASAGADGSLRLWDAAGGEALAAFTGYEGGVCCTWSSDGRRLASAGEDGTLRLWDAQTGEVLRIHAAWQDDQGSGHAVWVPGENRVVSAGGSAWRELSWQVRDAEGWFTRLPLETFGPIPGVSG